MHLRGSKAALRCETSRNPEQEMVVEKVVQQGKGGWAEVEKAVQEGVGGKEREEREEKGKLRLF